MDQDGFRIEAYGTATPPPEPDETPVEGTEDDEEA